MIQAQLHGARLAYVVVPIEGEVQRRVNMWTKKGGLTDKYVNVPGGYLVYFPRGHVLRIKNREELRHYKLDRDPELIDLKGLHDPKSPMGKLMMAEDDATRKGAFVDLQQQVIRIATAATGKIEVTRDPRELPTHED